MSDDIISLRKPAAPAFALGGFAQDRLTGYAGKLCARTEYLFGQTTWGLLSVKAVRADLGGMELATPQNFDWFPQERLEPVSPARLDDIAERQRASAEQKENAIYRGAERSTTAQSFSGKRV